MNDHHDTHPMTAHLRHAGEGVRLANHARYGDRRDITELYDTFGALSALVTRLAEFVQHVTYRLDQADSDLYETDCGRSADDALNSAHLATDEAFSKLSIAGNAVNDAWTEIGCLRIHDPGD